MRNLSEHSLSPILVAGLLCLPLCTGYGLSQVQLTGTNIPALADSLKRSLQAFDDDKTTQYRYAFVDLNGDKMPEAIVYLVGRAWCGSGGCSTLILRQNGGSWKIITNITVTQTPIRVLTTSTNGWRNLGVWVHGGGVQRGFEAELRFDGKTYPRNPTTTPARRLVGKVAGEVAISSPLNAAPLYP
jgi:hypothetical protein